MGASASFDAERRARFEAVFASAYEPMQRYVRRRGGGSETDDIVAEALGVVWRRIDDVPTDAVVPWCLGVARRCMANQRRSSKRRENLVRRLASQPDSQPGESSDPALHAALAKLDDDRREILRLWAWEGYGPGEIAAVLGISANAASIRLHRARHDLADLLAGGKKTEGAGHSSVEARDREEER